MRPDYERIAQPIGLIERKPKSRSHQTGAQADDEGQERKGQQAAVASRGFDLRWWFGHHRRTPAASALSYRINFPRTPPRAAMLSGRLPRGFRAGAFCDIPEYAEPEPSSR